MPRKVFVAGEILTAADVNTNLMDQAVMVFDDSTARGSAIPTPTEGMVTYLKNTDSVEVFKGAAFAPIASGFTDSETITATNASWPVPTLASPIVKVTVIGGGGGGTGQKSATAGNAGGTTTFDAGGAGTVTAAGGAGSKQPPVGTSVGRNGLTAAAGFVSSNGGDSGDANDSAGNFFGGSSGNGGQITVGYLDLTGVSTVNVTIGAGGAGVTGPATVTTGATGGRGEVIVEYVAG